MYKRISAASTRHPGRRSVRELLDSFEITGPDGSHRCLVHPPSVLTFLCRNPVRRLPAPDLAVVLRRLFLALDFLHTECKIIDTGALDLESTDRPLVLLNAGGRHQSGQHHAWHRGQLSLHRL